MRRWRRGGGRGSQRVLRCRSWAEECRQGGRRRRLRRPRSYCTVAVSEEQAARRKTPPVEKKREVRCPGEELDCKEASANACTIIARNVP